MEVLEITTTNKEFRYKAVDGTIFKDRDECIKYEGSCLCVLRSKLEIKSTDAWSLCFGYEDNIVDVIKGKTEDILKYASYLSKDFICNAKNDLERLLKIAKIDKDDCLLVFQNVDDEIYKMILKSELVEQVEDCCKIEQQCD